MIDLGQLAQEEISNAIGGTLASSNTTDSSISTQLAYYNRELPLLDETSPDGVSSYVEPVVQQLIDNTIAEVLPVFYGKNLSNNDPLNEVFNAINGIDNIRIGLFDSLLHGSAYVKVYIEERKSIKYDDYENVPIFAIGDIVGEIIEKEEVSPEVYNLRVRVITTTQEVVIDNIAPENILINSDHTCQSLGDARFVAQEYISSKADLIALGMDRDKVEQLTSYYPSEAQSNRNTLAISVDTDEVMVYDCYMTIADEETGLPMQVRVMIGESSSDVLFSEPYDVMPIVSGFAITTSHSIKGESIADRAMPVQDEKSYILRSIFDANVLNSIGRLEYNPDIVNTEDLQTIRRGGLVRSELVGQGISPIPQIPIDSSNYSVLTLLDNTIRTSAASEMNGIVGDSAHGIERQLSKLELSDALLAKTFSDSFVRPVFELLASITDIVLEDDISINIGFSYSEKQRRSGVLREILNYQQLLQQANSALFNETKVYNVLDDLLQLNNIKDSTEYFNDPMSPEYQEQIKIAEETATENKQKELVAVETQVAIAKAQVQISNAEMLKGEADQLRAQIKILEEKLNVNEEEAKLQLSYSQLEAKILSEDADRALEITKMDIANENADADRALEAKKLCLESQKADQLDIDIKLDQEDVNNA